MEASISSPPRVAEGKSIRRLLLGAVVLCLALQFWLGMRTEFNWDEYFFLAHIYDFQRGELGQALQTFHVQLFGWLTAVPGDEIDQLRMARLAMLGCQAVTLVMLYRLARAFFAPVPSLLAVLAFASAGFTLMHGSSYRADPIATALMMISLAALARQPLDARSALLVSVSAAIAALVTVKVIFYAPAFVGIAAWRVSTAENPKKVLGSLALTAITAGILLLVLFLAHSAALPDTRAANDGMLANAGRTTLLEAGILPRRHEILRAVTLSPAAVILMFVGLVAIATGDRSVHGTRWRRFAILSCAAPLLALLFYRNAFPYFFPFITAPASLLVAAAASEIDLLKRWPVIAALALIIPAPIIAITWQRARPQQTQQKLIAAVHQIFPQPVNYIDRSSMISSFPKRGFFMSGWGMLNYHAGEPVFQKILSEHPVPLLLINGAALEHGVGRAASVAPHYALKPVDQEVLRQNFIPHWGPVWVAGKELTLRPGGQSLRIAVPGSYTVEGSAIRLNGRLVRPNQIVNLERGFHRVSGPTGANVTLRWGERLARPPEQPPPTAPFIGF